MFDGFLRNGILAPFLLDISFKMFKSVDNLCVISTVFGGKLCDLIDQSTVLDVITACLVVALLVKALFCWLWLV